MTAIDRTINPSPDSPYPDCDAFLNWDEEYLGTKSEIGVLFRSLVATLKVQPSIDASLEAKAVIIIEYVSERAGLSESTFLRHLGRITDESLTNFVQSIVVLISSPNEVITKAGMKMLGSLIDSRSGKVRLALLHADLIPQLISTFNPLSLSFTEAVGIHTCLMKTIRESIWLATPDGLIRLSCESGYEPQTVRETVLQQVLIPSEKYIWHFCVNRYSIVVGEQSRSFRELLVQLLRICAYYQPTLDFVLHTPIVFTILSWLAFIDTDYLIYCFLNAMMNVQWEWNRIRGTQREKWQSVHRMLRMEGFEDVIEEKLQNDQNEYDGRWIIENSIDWNNMQGMNVPK
ncbi:hypothetical protein BLNAU_7462 [Blattamonas nauphoetae]|uniref:Uncharacterized protein n=1 Tax=Blattamonas nauphoetae TaxID=2049346 RepID=A0ABQ9Y1H4_9EUKA|nr:hypothetical protein BLNAU_7462 [Blattamonas nauphoetae]